MKWWNGRGKKCFTSDIVAWTQSLMWLFVGRLMKAVLRIIRRHLEQTICVTAQLCLKTEAHLNQFVAPFQTLALRQQASVSPLHCVVRLSWHKLTASLYRSDIFFNPRLLFLLLLHFLTANCKQMVKTVMRSDYKFIRSDEAEFLPCLCWVGLNK